MNFKIKFPMLLLGTLITFLFINLSMEAQIDTKQLKTEVEKAINGYYDEDFRIIVDGQGIVTIEGQVKTLFDKLNLGELIEAVEGVKGVNNKIAILNDITADNIIKANIKDDLERNDAISEPEKIIVEVKDGVVTLSGEVSYYREKVIAQSIASWQDGVSDLISKIVVLPPLVAKSDENIKGIIKDLLARHFSLEKNVGFSIIDGIVTFSGEVNNLWAKNHIELETLHILGVKNVINNIKLKPEY